MKTLITILLSSLVFLLPAHTQPREGAALAHQVVPVVASMQKPVIEPENTLEAMLYPVKDVGTYANLYAPFNCTWFVASKLPVPNTWGDAISWGYEAAADGYTISNVPKIGAIAQSSTDYYLGHVALVQAINGDQVEILEMNYTGLGVVDTRIANPGEFVYIYF